MIGATPLPMVQEYQVDSILPGRMVASPPDHIIPFATAVYMHSGYDGREKSREFFGDWNIASRGPLVPLAENGLFHLANAQIRDGSAGLSDQHRWPVTWSGEDISRLFGWLLNVQIVLAAYALLSTLDVRDGRLRQALVWTALAPGLIVNTLFLWPKLLAASFLLFAVTAILRRRAALAGAFAALAWLSHPVGALLIPAIGLFALVEPPMRPGSEPIPWRWRVAIRQAAVFAVVATACMAPWLAYKAMLGASDSFMTYPLGWGRGVERAPNVAAWLQARWQNMTLTLIPGSFYLSGNMRSWMYGPIPDYLRWTIQQAKSLPGELGMFSYPWVVLALLWPQRSSVSRVFKYVLLLFGFFVELLFWGYSSDGLGRNCLEPLTVLCIAYVAQAQYPGARGLSFALPLVALEALWLMWSSYDWGYIGLAGLKLDSWLCLTLNLVIVGLMLAVLPSPEWWAGLRSKLQGKAFA